MGRVGRVGTVGRNSYLTSPGNNPGHGGETSGPHAHLRLIIVLVPVFNHRASTHLPKSFSVDPTHSMWTFTGRRCNALQCRNIGWLIIQLATMYNLCTARQYVVSEQFNI